MDMTSIS